MPGSTGQIKVKCSLNGTTRGESIPTLCWVSLQKALRMQAFVLQSIFGVQNINVDFLKVSKQNLSKYQKIMDSCATSKFLMQNHFVSPDYHFFLQQFLKCTEIEENHAVSSFFLCRVTRWNISGIKIELKLKVSYIVLRYTSSWKVFSPKKTGDVFLFLFRRKETERGNNILTKVATYFYVNWILD